MIIRVQVKLRSKHPRIERIQDLDGNDIYLVYIQSMPIQGKANEELISMCSDYFHCLKKNVKIVAGFTSTSKTLNIEH